MKKGFFIMAAIAAIVCSCEPENDCLPCQEEKTATLNVSLDFEESNQTKAASYITAQAYETAVNDVQILVFDSTGALNAYVDADSKTSGISINTTAGSKTVWAVVNGPDLKSISTLEALQGKVIDLDDNSTNSSEGFVMAGSTSCTVGNSTTTTQIRVSRFVSRIALQKINNSLPSSYGLLTIHHITLTNVVGNQNLTGTASHTTWYNKMGRDDNGNKMSIIDGYSYWASCSSLTHINIDEDVDCGSCDEPSTPYLFYAFPNNTTTDVTGWSSPFTARKTRLVVAAEISGTAYYYPVVIDSPARNTAYTVELTITGLGSTDPDQPVVKGSITASVTVQGWSTGAVYEETI